MESWNAATWAKIASHAALVAAHLKELESAASAQSFQPERRLDHDYRMSLSGLISAAPSNMRACFESSFGNSQDIVSPSCRVDGTSTAPVLQHSAPQCRASCTASILQHDAPSVTHGHGSATRKTAVNARRGANDRIEKLRQYDRVKKREQRDKHCELVRKVHVHVYISARAYVYAL
jgi:hypothetical protein